MKRTCNGNDPNLPKPGCGRTFDDFDHFTYCPHEGFSPNVAGVNRAAAVSEAVPGAPTGDETTKGIPMARKETSLGLLQRASPSATPSDEDKTAVATAANDILSYHAVNEDQKARLELLTAEFTSALLAICAFAPPGPERSTAISRLREAKYWSANAIALEG